MPRIPFLRRARAPLPRVDDNVRVYVVGDIHGCDDLFEELLNQIRDDHEARSSKHLQIVLLGDLVDRGPGSSKVVERARKLAMSDLNFHAIVGNHEQLLLRTCAGDEAAARIFARNGGRETALSYGVDPDEYDAADFSDLSGLLKLAIPVSHLKFLAEMKRYVVAGDYAFVHAGIKPGVPLAKQTDESLLWIRDRFLLHRGPHEKFIVHGHTITESVDEKDNRLGIDTGAYASGRLTAVALEGDRRWFLQT